jgi:hypothetical protein
MFVLVSKRYEKECTNTKRSMAAVFVGERLPDETAAFGAAFNVVLGHLFN